MRTDSLLQPAQHSLEDSGTWGHLVQMWVPSLHTQVSIRTYSKQS